jgi:hypothetical protein
MPIMLHGRFKERIFVTSLLNYEPILTVTWNVVGTKTSCSFKLRPTLTLLYNLASSFASY